MLNFPQTSLEEVLDSSALNASNALHFSPTHESILSRYVYPAIKLGINPIISILPQGRYCIAGGVFRSLFFNELPSDVDIYPLASSTNVITIYNNAIRKSIKSKKISGNTGTNSHIDIITFDGLQKLPYKIQIISKSIVDNGISVLPTEVDDILSAFDIIPACFGIDISIETSPVSSVFPSFTLNSVVIHPDYFYSLGNKLLLLNTGQSPLYEKQMSAERFYKYTVNYGFRIPNNEVMAQFNNLINKKISGMDIEYV